MKKMLFKSILIISFLLITFFSLYNNSYAASFAYKDFNWEEFSKQNRNYWVSFCMDNDPDCEDKLLVLKKRFYIRLYSLLTTVEQKYGTIIDDNLIIATVFLGYNMESFRDPVQGEENSYNLDDSDSSATKNSYIGDDSGDKNAAYDYFKEETDTLKTLINNFIGYRMTCYGVSNETPISNSEGVLTCNNGLTPYNGKCVEKLDDFKGTFYEAIGLDISNDKGTKCEELGNANGYSTVEISSSTTREVSDEFFYDFLEDSDYLDRKEALRDYYSPVLSRTKKQQMKDLTQEEYIEHYDEIVGIRKRLIRRIQEIVKNYEGISEKFNTPSTNQYWWPIGSDEVNEVDGISFANGQPSQTNISSNFGNRNGEQHNGVDIPGTLGVTNVIASKDGVVAYSSLSANVSCLDDANETCGSGYGNYVIIEHIDGNYTLYAHMAKDSITLNVGDSVKQGQVIGKVGNSGRSTGPHLHFEVRVGGNDSTSVQNPMNYISNTNPRPFGGGSKLFEFIANMEGTGPQEGDNYKVYNDSGGVATVGHGITLKYNREDFLAHGINPDTLNVGSLVPKVIVDAIYQSDLDTRASNIKSLLARQNVILNDDQIAALISLQFNCGNINGFFDNYARYGSSQALCDNWWHNKALHDANGNRLSGLEKRRKAECDLFVNGNYNMNVYG